MYINIIILGLDLPSRDQKRDKWQEGEEEDQIIPLTSLQNNKAD